MRLRLTNSVAARSRPTTASIEPPAKEESPLEGSSPLPVAGGRGATAGGVAGGVARAVEPGATGVAEGGAAGVGVDVAVGDCGVPVVVAVIVVVAVAVVVAVPVVVVVTVVVAVPAVVGEAVTVVVPVPAVEVAVVLAVADGVPGVTWLVTAAWQVTSAPPPLAESLHWSTFTGKLAVVVEGATVQTKPTFVPPLPDPLH